MPQVSPGARDDIQVDEQLSGRPVKKGAGGNKRKGAEERCAESGTFPTRSDSDGHAVSMIVR